MPPTYAVQAQVVDLRADVPRPTDRFLVDTNVWAWRHYQNCRVTISGRTVPQSVEYSSYLDQIVAAGAALLHAGTSLAELAHLIERNEPEIYCASVANLSIKEYRHDRPAERIRVVNEIQSSWAKVVAESTLLTLSLDAGTLKSAELRLAANPIDGYDLFLLEVMSISGVTQLVSDDGDFCCVAGIEVYTANPRVLAAARAQGRLLVR